MGEQQDQNNSIYKNDMVYRPMVEKNSALLEVQTGCSYGKCAFCDFIKDEFQVLPMEKIEQNIEILAGMAPEKNTLFLLGQNALSIPTGKLLKIFHCIGRHMPNIKEISLYGRAEDILKKGRDDLWQLSLSGLRTVHMGIESGSDRVLHMMNKGETAGDFLAASKLLHETGIFCHTTYILGLGGRFFWREHVQKTAEIYNRIRPVSIWALALKIWPGTPLFHQYQAKKFLPLKPEEMLMEEKLILEQLRVEECMYMDTTALNQFTIIGSLQRDKARMLKGIDDLLEPYSLDDLLNS